MGGCSKINQLLPGTAIPVLTQGLVRKIGGSGALSSPVLQLESKHLQTLTMQSLQPWVMTQLLSISGHLHSDHLAEL